MGSVLLFCVGVIILHMRSGMCQLDSSLIPPISDSMIIQKLSPIINIDADDLEGCMHYAVVKRLFHTLKSFIPDRSVQCKTGVYISPCKSPDETTCRTAPSMCNCIHAYIPRTIYFPYRFHQFYDFLDSGTP